MAFYVCCASYPGTFVDVVDRVLSSKLLVSIWREQGLPTAHKLGARKPSRYGATVFGRQNLLPLSPKLLKNLTVFKGHSLIYLLFLSFLLLVYH